MKRRGERSDFRFGFSLQVLHVHMRHPLRMALNTFRSVNRLPIMNTLDHPAVCTQVTGLGKHG